MPTVHTNTRGIRFVVERGDFLGQLCKVGFSSSDASIYLFPYSRDGRYHFGRMSLPAQEQSATVPFDQQESASQTPHLSIHETGQVHVKAPGSGSIAGPMQAGPLSAYRGQHIASVTCPRFDGLVPLGRAPNASGTEPDIVIPADSELESGRLVFYINAEEPTFAGRCVVTTRLIRPTLKTPLFLGVGVFAQKNSLDETGRAGGVIAIAGWNGLRPPGIAEPADNLYVVAG